MFTCLGLICDKCKEGTFNFGSDLDLGCEDCPCSMDGTVHGEGSCDATTGQCNCKYNVEGQFCNRFESFPLPFVIKKVIICS